MIGAKRKLSPGQEQMVRDWYLQKIQLGTLKQFCKRERLSLTTVQSVLQRMRHAMQAYDRFR